MEPSALGLAGDGQEDVVERRTPDPQVVKGDVLRLEPAADGQQERRAGPGGDADRLVVAVGVGRGPAQLAQQDGRPVEVTGVADPGLEHVTAQLVLQLVGGAVGDDRSEVEDDDPVRQALGLLHVLGGEQDGGPRRPPTPR